MKRFKVQSLNGVRLYNEKRTYKIDDVVEHNSVVYQNVLGKSSVPGLDDNWISISEKTVKDFVSVRDFGALGNGFWNGTEYTGTDDTNSFALALATGKDVFIPEGNYILDSESVTTEGVFGFRGLHLNSNQRVFGKGLESKLIMNGIINGDTDTYFNAFNIVNKQNCEVSDIYITGSKQEYEELLTFNKPNVGINIFGEFIKNIKVNDCFCEYILGHGIQDNSEKSYNEYYNNTTNYCSQNGINANGNFVKLIENYGKGNGFGLIEASCGNSIIKGNIAEFNLVSGISIGGYNDEETNGHGDNNIISDNICNNNSNIGLNITIGVVNSIISNNNVFKNGRFGLVLNETYNKQSNNSILNNNIFDNGINLTEQVGLYVNSKGNFISNNNIYNTEESILTDDFQKFGIAVASNKTDNFISNNKFKNISNYEISIEGPNSVDINQSTFDRINSPSNVIIKNKSNKVGIGYDGQPILNTETYVWADNVSSPKTAILPDAEKYPEGQILTVVDEKGSAGTNNIILQTVSGNKINGVIDAEYVLNNNYETLQLTNVKSQKNWIVLNKQGESRTGWARYKDTQYTVSSPLNVPSGTTIILPNNALSIINNEIPSDTVSFYNPATKKITPTNNGDFYIINVRFKAKTSVVNDGLLVDINIGGALGVISEESKSFIRGANSEQKFNLVFTTFSGATFLANGGDVRLTTLNGNLQLYDIDYVIKRTHKSKLL